MTAGRRSRRAGTERRGSELPLATARLEDEAGAMRGAVALGQEPVPAHYPLTAAQPLWTFLAREEGPAAAGRKVAEVNCHGRERGSCGQHRREDHLGTRGNRPGPTDSRQGEYR